MEVLMKISLAETRGQRLVKKALLIDSVEGISNNLKSSACFRLYSVR